MSDHDNIMDAFNNLFYRYWCFQGYEDLVNNSGDLRFAFHLFCTAFGEYQTLFNLPENERGDLTLHFQKQAMLQSKYLPSFLNFMRLPVNQPYYTQYSKDCNCDLYGRVERDLIRRVESDCEAHGVEYKLDEKELRFLGKY